MIKTIKSFVFSLYTQLLFYPTLLRWNRYCKDSSELRLVVGASKTNFQGWFATEYYFLDITESRDFENLFAQRKFDFLLAEHVLEHIPNEGLDKMVKLFFKHSSSSCNIRIAVPDGYHTDPAYIANVRPGGVGPGAHDHKNLFTYQSLAALFERAGFKSKAVEYWDEKGVFHRGYVNDDKGFIHRSMANDKRNASGKPIYTSLIMDFTKA